MPVINLKIRSGKGWEWVCVLSGMPETYLSDLREIKPQLNVVSKYEYKPFMGPSRLPDVYYTLSWTELSTDTTAPVSNINAVFNFFDDLGYKVVTSNAMGTDGKSGDYRFIIWTFQK